METLGFASGQRQPRVESGKFAMPYNGGRYWFGGTFSVPNNATVILNVATTPNAPLGDYITRVGGARWS